ncbi:MAG TPA: hypothetical protein VJN69_13695 [Candidatus Acidoferrales bacterium]|jgi:hypothetical protein|nr:hypothetical protein [Candidatus Acidoferrales bacterium]
MAKGWESKAVESQVQDAQSERNNNKTQLTVAQIEANRRKQVLLLSRARVADGLQSSSDSRYRDQLTRALADLDAQISQLSNN